MLFDTYNWLVIFLLVGVHILTFTLSCLKNEEQIRHNEICEPERRNPIPFHINKWIYIHEFEKKELSYFIWVLRYLLPYLRLVTPVISIFAVLEWVMASEMPCIIIYDRS